MTDTEAARIAAIADGLSEAQKMEVFHFQYKTASGRYSETPASAYALLRKDILDCVTPFRGKPRPWSLYRLTPDGVAVAALLRERGE